MHERCRSVKSRRRPEGIDSYAIKSPPPHATTRREAGLRVEVRERGLDQGMAIQRDDAPDLSIRTLGALRAAEAECTRCPLYRFATQVVPGEGPARAHLMLVG